MPTAEQGACEGGAGAGEAQRSSIADNDGGGRWRSQPGNEYDKLRFVGDSGGGGESAGVSDDAGDASMPKSRVWDPATGKYLSDELPPDIQEMMRGRAPEATA